MYSKLATTTTALPWQQHAANAPRVNEHQPSGLTTAWPCATAFCVDTRVFSLGASATRQ